MNALCAVLRHFSLLNVEDEDIDNVNVMCLYHNDRSPSLSVNEHSYHCWACDAKGSFLKLLIDLDVEQRRGEEEKEPEPINDFEAYILLAKIKKSQNVKDENSKKIPSPKYTQQESLLYAERFISSLRTPAWDSLSFHPFISDKGFSIDTLYTFGVKINQQSKYSTVIPIVQNGILKGYTSRIWGEDVKPKYKHSPGFSKECVIGGSLRSGSVLIVEGITDTMKAWQYGWDNVCCLFGWHCSKDQADFILQFATSIIDGLDEDEAGRKGGNRLKEVFGDRRPIYRLPISQIEKDPCGMSEKNFKRSICNLQLA